MLLYMLLINYINVISMIVSWIPACPAALIHFDFVVAVSYTLYVLHGLFQDGAEYGCRVASSYQTLQFFVCFTDYFAVFRIGCLQLLLPTTDTHF